MGLKFDLYNNAGEGSNSTGVYVGGVSPETAAVDLSPSGIDLHSGRILRATVSGSSAGLTLTLVDTVTAARFQRLFSVDLVRALGGSTAYVGFTAGTGAKSAVQKILNWTFTSTAVPSSVCQSGSACFPAGFASGTGLVFNGKGNSVTSGVLQLTDNSFEASSTYFSTQLPSSSFATDFDFRFANGSADGFTFVVQSAGQGALGSAGGGLGYGPDRSDRVTPLIPGSLAFKFDLHNNEGEGNNSVGDYGDGGSPTVPANSLAHSGVDLHSGHTFHVRINSYAVPEEATVFNLVITDLTKYATYTFQDVGEPYNYGDLAHTYFGFTAGTGTGSDKVQILNWTLFTSDH